MVIYCLRQFYFYSIYQSEVILDNFLFIVCLPLVYKLHKDRDFVYLVYHCFQNVNNIGSQ